MDTRFGNQIEDHRDALLRAALRLCHGDSPLADDMVQETYCKAIRHARSFSPGTNLRAWLMRILHNTVMSAYRHRQVARENSYPEGYDPVTEGPVDPARLEVSDELTRALDALPGEYRRVFLMAALEDLPYQVIATRLGIPVGTVMSRLWRARKALQQQLVLASAN